MFVQTFIKHSMPNHSTLKAISLVTLQRVIIHEFVKKEGSLSGARWQPLQQRQATALPHQGRPRRSSSCRASQARRRHPADARGSCPCQRHRRPRDPRSHGRGGRGWRRAARRSSGPARACRGRCARRRSWRRGSRSRRCRSSPPGSGPGRASPGRWAGRCFPWARCRRGRPGRGTRGRRRCRPWFPGRAGFLMC